ncbi:MAG: M55 family metallopeptidase [Pseudomonadota bacterium]
MKIYISADIEGVAGVVSPAQTVVAGFEYDNARKWMTGEVIAACEGAHEAGAEEIIVSDSHGNGQSLLIDLLPDYVRVVRNWPRPLQMMQGVETEGVAGAFLLGYHTGHHHSEGVLAHTTSGLLYTELRLNGRLASETTISAAIAAHFGIPTIFASGDDAYIRHAKEELGSDIAVVETKRAYGRYSAISLTPVVAQTKIREAAKQAVKELSVFQAKPVQTPITLEADFQRHIPAELMNYLPGITRTGARTIMFQGADMVEVSKLIAFMTSVRFDEQLP